MNQTKFILLIISVKSVRDTELLGRTDLPNKYYGLFNKKIWKNTDGNHED